MTTSRKIIPTKPAALNSTSPYVQRRYQDRMWVLGEGLTRAKYVDTTEYYPTEHDYFLLVDTDAAGGAVTIYLPTGVAYKHKQYVVKVLDNTYGVTVSRLGSDTIDGATTYTLNAQYEWAQFIACFDGSSVNWFVLSQTPMGSRLQSQRIITTGSNAWTIPTDARGNKISMVWVTILGGGGAGGGTTAGTTAGGGGGGAGGCLVRFPYWIDTAQSSLTAYVGAGGTGVAGAAGNNGTDSYVSGTGMQTITAYGGVAGTAGGPGAGAHGNGGNGGGYQISGGGVVTNHGLGATTAGTPNGYDGGGPIEMNCIGGGGGYGDAGRGGSIPNHFAGGWSNAGQSGSGGASFFGVGAHGAAAGAAGNAPGSGLGGGGSGARGDGVVGALAGGDGKLGMVLFEWIV